jgi:hypothetical protein
MGAPEIEASLSQQPQEANISASTQHQAFTAQERRKLYQKRTMQFVDEVHR